MDQRILLRLCKMGGREQDFVNQAFNENWVVPLGPNVDGFENDLEKFLLKNSSGFLTQAEGGKEVREEKFLNRKKVAALSSGTAALHLGLVELGVGKEDYVIVQSLTFSASANPVKYQGAIPVFVDSEPETWNIDPELLDHAIADIRNKTGKLPKAILPVHLYGMPAKMNEILQIADKWKIPILEDAAEAFGSEYRGQKCGTFGRYGALSFNGNKMITTSGGGALVCPDEEARKSVTSYATQSREPFPWYEHEKIGFNYRLSNICAGIGRGQMLVAEDYIRHHRKIHDLYREAFSHIPGISLHENPDESFESNFWLSTITLDDSLRIKGDDGCGAPEALRRSLNTANIESRPIWKPMHLQPFFKNCPAYINGESEKIFKSGLCLPSGPWVGEKEIDYILSTIRQSIV